MNSTHQYSRCEKDTSTNHEDNTMNQCEYCKNRATRNRGDVELCEIHYAYLRPAHAKVNPIKIGRCIRCGCRSLNRSGGKERLIDHHVNYPLDLTVPVCDACHQEIQSEMPEDRYLEQVDRTTSPYHPVGSSSRKVGWAIHPDYQHEERRNLNKSCPECSTALMYAPDEMEFGEPYLCPNSECRETELDEPDLW